MLQNADDPRRLVNELDLSKLTPLYLAVERPSTDIRIVLLLLEAGADTSFRPSPNVEWRSLLEVALNVAPFETIVLLHANGADLLNKDKHGYTSLFTAVGASIDRLKKVEFLIALGVDFDATSTYSESAIRSAYHYGYFEVVKALLDAGANDYALKWNPLFKAIAIGTLEDVRAALSLNFSLNATDCWDRKAIHVAILRGDIEIVEMLLESGAKLEPIRGFLQKSTEPMAIAVESGNKEIVRWLYTKGCSVESKDYMGHTCLTKAVSAGDHEMIKLLLALGANPNAGGEFDYVVNNVLDKQSLLLIASGGADLNGLQTEQRRILLDLTEGEEVFESLSPSDYHTNKFRKAGSANPQDMTNPFWLAMIRCGCNAYRARDHFSDLNFGGCEIKKAESTAVWCFDRYGQSTTILPDDRIILIAGEHEDSYDPDFCIYNDVTVFHPDGEIQIFGYPFEVYPPTDFHSATLVGDYIYIIGSLGYYDRRDSSTPVYRLDISNFQIEPLPTDGKALPGRIYDHRAKLLNSQTIRISGGKYLVRNGKNENIKRNTGVFDLCLETGEWKTVLD